MYAFNNCLALVAELSVTLRVASMTPGARLGWPWAMRWSRSPDAKFSACESLAMPPGVRLLCKCGVLWWLIPMGPIEGPGVIA